MINPTDELLDLVDENNQPLGITKLRSEVHREMKDWQRSTGVFIINAKKQLLCHKRSVHKDANPGAWSAHSGGHLTSGQTYEDNAVAELKEELGLIVDPSDLIPVTIAKNYEHLHHSQLYIYIWNGKEQDLRFTDGEIEQVKWMTREEYIELIRQSKPNFQFNPENITIY